MFLLALALLLAAAALALHLLVLAAPSIDALHAVAAVVVVTTERLAGLDAVQANPVDADVRLAAGLLRIALFARSIEMHAGLVIGPDRRRSSENNPGSRQHAQCISPRLTTGEDACESVEARSIHDHVSSIAAATIVIISRA